MEKKNLIKILIPIVAILVVIQSVILISKNKTQVKPKSEEMDLTEQPTKNLESSNEDAVYTIDISSKTPQLSLNKTGTVSVKMLGKSDHNLDSINVYVKYDPKAFEISDLKFDSRLPAPAFSKVSTLRGLVVANFLITEAEGLSVKTGDILDLMTFQVKPKSTGSFDFEISTGSEMRESATMIVENTTSKILPFASSKLTVTVAR